MSSAITISGLSKKYGDKNVLGGIDGVSDISAESVIVIALNFAAAYKRKGLE